MLAPYVMGMTELLNIRVRVLSDTNLFYYDMDQLALAKEISVVSD